MSTETVNYLKSYKKDQLYNIKSPYKMRTGYNIWLTTAEKNLCGKLLLRAKIGLAQNILRQTGNNIAIAQ